MKKLFVMLLVFCLCSMFTWAVDFSWNFDSDTTDWNNGGWGSTIAHDTAEGHDSAGSLKCTDTDGYYGVRTSFVVGDGDPPYTIEAWVKIISLPSATGGLSLDTWNLDTSGSTSVDFDDSVTDSWQSQTQSGNADTGGTNTSYDNFIMILGGADGDAADPGVEYYVDDVTYTEGSSVTDWALYTE